MLNTSFHNQNAFGKPLITTLSRRTGCTRLQPAVAEAGDEFYAAIKRRDSRGAAPLSSGRSSLWLYSSVIDDHEELSAVTDDFHSGVSIVRRSQATQDRMSARVAADRVNQNFSTLKFADQFIAIEAGALNRRHALPWFLAVFGVDSVYYNAS